MADSGSQPDFQPSIQSFLSFLNRVASSFEVINPDPPEDPTFLVFAVRDKVQAYLEENEQEKLKQIIATLFPQGDGIFPNDILPNNIAVFCTLLKIAKGRWIKHFRRHKSLSDDQLPFDPTSKPPNWPEDTGDPDFLKKFCEEQWQFCVPVISQPFADQHFHQDTILPIVFKKSLNSGGSATLWQIKLYPAYNKLITDQEKARLKDSADTFVLKTYITATAATSYAREVEAFRRLNQHGRDTGIIGFHGSFTRGDSYNVLLEYADKGTLEDYFRNEIPPVDPEEIIQFWEALFKIIDALRRIHQTHPDGGPFIFHGWHQDVKPENILVVSNGSENASEWDFKLADLGTSHFKRVDTSRQDSTASDSYGTRTYGAPECYRPDETSVRDKLRVGQNVDIWSLGCVYSEIARWIKNQYKGVQAYRGERRKEISNIPEFRDADCFHNGDVVLTAVRESHKMSTTNLRTGDYITKAVVERMIPDMLDIALARPTAEKLWYKSKGIVAEARKELQSANAYPSREQKASRSTMGSSRTVPEHGPPAPPIPPPGISPPESPGFNGSYQQGRGISYDPNRMPPYRRGDSDHILPSPPPIHTGGQQSPGRDSIGEDSVWTGNLPARANPQHAPYQSRYSDRRDIPAREGLKQTIQTGVYVGPQSEISGMAAGHERDITMNGGSPRGIRNRYSDHSEGYSRSPILGQAGTSRRSGSPDEMGDTAFTPSTHSRHISRGESSHSRVTSDSSTLSIMLNSVAQPPNTDSSTSVPQMQRRPPPAAVHRTANNSTPVTPPERWSVEEALEWKRDRKDSGIHKPIPNPQLHDRLRKRDHIFLVDDSVTMTPHWKKLTKVFEALSYILKDVDPNGLDLSFTISRETLTKAKRTSKLVEAVRSRSQQLKGTTDMNLRLTEILDSYQTELEKPKSFFGKSILPMNLYILTDGIWEPNCDAAGPIRNLVNKLNKLHKGRVQVGIQFISFGNNADALTRLDILDSGLGLKPDIVDHEPSDGDVWKMLLGSTNDYYDSQNELQLTPARASNEVSSMRVDKEYT